SSRTATAPADGRRTVRRAVASAGSGNGPRRSSTTHLPLPDFPGVDPRLTFFTWLRGNIEASEVGVHSSLLGATTSTSLKHLTSSMTLAHGLPRLLRRCVDGDFTIEHVAHVTRRCRDLRFEHFPAIDDCLAERRADITIETFKRSLAL